MVAAVNPCGLALLPAYLGLYLGAGETAAGWKAIPCALAVSGVVTLSFVLLFGAVGLVLSAARSAAAIYLPWVGLVIGVVLVLAAGRILAGLPIYGSLGGPSGGPHWEPSPGVEGGFLAGMLEFLLSGVSI